MASARLIAKLRGIALAAVTLSFFVLSTAGSAEAQGFGGRVSYTGALGPVNAERPLCLCIYTGPALTGGLGCLILRRNDATYDIELGGADYYVIAFLDIHSNERLDADEPYEIYRDRGAAPADPIGGASGRSDIDLIFGDENLSGAPTDSPTATPTQTPSPTPSPSPVSTPSPTATFTASSTPSPTSTSEPTSTVSPTPAPPTQTPAAPTQTPTCGDSKDAGCSEACIGDCDGNGEVGLNELIAVVSDALASARTPACAAGDADGDGTVQVGEVVAAVGWSLSGCPEP
jgi:hypothetical protein